MRTFQFRFVIRTLLLCATLILFAFFININDFFFVTIAVALLAAYQIYALIQFTGKTNRDISRFLDSIKYDDTSQTFAGDGLGTSFGELNEAFNKVMRKLKDARSEMEIHTRYLNTIIQHVGIGLLAYKPDGKVILINSAAKKLLRIPGLADVNNLTQTYPGLVETLLMLKQSEKKLVKIQTSEGETGYVSIFGRAFLLREQKYILVSLQNIQAELEEKEMEAWQNLIKVLTHEIMNSITPISSMTSTLLDMLGADEKNHRLPAAPLGREEVEEMAEALKTIHQRSQGLTNFVNSYRNMTLIPKPKFRLLSIAEFFKRIEQLMDDKLAANGISFRWSVEPGNSRVDSGPGSDGTGHDQSALECNLCSGRKGESSNRALSFIGVGRKGDDLRRRQWGRNCRGSSRKNLHTILHDQAAGVRHRA